MIQLATFSAVTIGLAQPKGPLQAANVTDVAAMPSEPDLNVPVNVTVHVTTDPAALKDMLGVVKV